MKRDWRAESVSYGDEKEGVEVETSRYANQYGQSQDGILEYKTMDKGQRAESASYRDKKEGIRAGVSRYAK